MTFSHDFVTAVATIAAKAQDRWRTHITPEQAVVFAWFSVNEVGDASIDDNDLVEHFHAWRTLTK